MSHPLRHRTRSDAGLTMIELLVTVIIVGVLAAIAIPLYGMQRTRANDATLKRDLHNTAKSVEAFYADGYTNAAPAVASNYVYMNSNGLPIWPATTETATTGFPATKVTPSSGIGVRFYLAQGGYCILGMRKGSSYEYGQILPATYDHLLYYDSLLGGVKTRPQLTAAGACQQFKV